MGWVRQLHLCSHRSSPIRRVIHRARLSASRTRHQHRTQGGILPDWHHNSGFHPGQGAAGVLHLAALHPVATNLHLGIHAAHKEDQPIRVVLAQIPGTVPALALLIHRVAFRGQLRLAKVARGYPGATNPQLTRHIVRLVGKTGHIRVHHPILLAGQRATVGNGRPVCGEVHIRHHILVGPDGPLRRPTHRNAGGVRADGGQAFR